MKKETAEMCIIIGVIIFLMYLVIMFVFGLNEVGHRQGGFIGLIV